MKHILVIRLSAMGDVAMAATVLRIFSNQNPSVKITFLSKSFLQPLFTEIPNSTFHIANTNGKHKGVFGIYKLYQELKSLQIDAIADLHNVLRSKILKVFFFGLKKATLDKGRADKKALTRAENKEFKQLKPTHERYADVFRELGYKVDLSKTNFPKPKELTQHLKNLIRNKNPVKLIGIAPFAQYSTKTYPLDLMENVIFKLSEKQNYVVLLFGGGKEQVNILSAIENTFANVICIAGKITLAEELILISNLDCMLSMDSGNAHFSAMFGVKTITIWGNTHPFAGFYPFGQSLKNALIPDLKKFPKIPTSVYGNKKVDGYEDVMRSISPETVVHKILENL